MRIGIDISQIVYEGTGVSRYVRNMVRTLVSQKSDHEFILFGGAIRQSSLLHGFIAEMHAINPRVRGVIVSLSPRILDFLWNRLHIVPVEWFTGSLDVFWSSDWTQPPLSRAVGVTTIHDLTVLLYPESFASSIVSVQKRRLRRAKDECSMFLCDSEATKKDLVKLLKIPDDRLHVVYPGYNLGN